MTAIVTTTVRTDAEIRDKLNSEAFEAIEFVAKIARGNGAKPSKGMSNESISEMNREENRRMRANELLVTLWAKAITAVKQTETPPVTPEQGLQQARGALVAMPAELAGVVREPAVREAIRKAWDDRCAARP